MTRLAVPSCAWWLVTLVLLVSTTTTQAFTPNSPVRTPGTTSTQRDYGTVDDGKGAATTTSPFIDAIVEGREDRRRRRRVRKEPPPMPDPPVTEAVDETVDEVSVGLLWRLEQTFQLELDERGGAATAERRTTLEEWFYERYDESSSMPPTVEKKTPTGPEVEPKRKAEEVKASVEPPVQEAPAPAQKVVVESTMKTTKAPVQIAQVTAPAKKIVQVTVPEKTVLVQRQHEEWATVKKTVLSSMPLVPKVSVPKPEPILAKKSLKEALKASITVLQKERVAKKAVLESKTTTKASPASVPDEKEMVAKTAVLETTTPAFQAAVPVEKERVTKKAVLESKTTTKALPKASVTVVEKEMVTKKAVLESKTTTKAPPKASVTVIKKETVTKKAVLETKTTTKAPPASVLDEKETLAYFATPEKAEPKESLLWPVAKEVVLEAKTTQVPKAAVQVKPVVVVKATVAPKASVQVKPEAVVKAAVAETLKTTTEAVVKAAVAEAPTASVQVPVKKEQVTKKAEAKAKVQESFLQAWSQEITNADEVKSPASREDFIHALQNKETVKATVVEPLRMEKTPEAPMVETPTNEDNWFHGKVNHFFKNQVPSFVSEKINGIREEVSPMVKADRFSWMDIVIPAALGSQLMEKVEDTVEQAIALPQVQDMLEKSKKHLPPMPEVVQDLMENGKKHLPAMSRNAQGMMESGMTHLPAVSSFAQDLMESGKKHLPPMSNFAQDLITVANSKREEYVKDLADGKKRLPMSGMMQGLIYAADVKKTELVKDMVDGKKILPMPKFVQDFLDAADDDKKSMPDFVQVLLSGSDTKKADVPDDIQGFLAACRGQKTEDAQKLTDSNTKSVPRPHFVQDFLAARKSEKANVAQVVTDSKKRSSPMPGFVKNFVAVRDGKKSLPDVVNGMFTTADNAESPPTPDEVPGMFSAGYGTSRFNFPSNVQALFTKSDDKQSVRDVVHGMFTDGDGRSRLSFPDEKSLPPFVQSLLSTREVKKSQPEVAHRGDRKSLPPLVQNFFAVRDGTKSLPDLMHGMFPTRDDE
jgi:hypothetical protein